MKKVVSVLLAVCLTISAAACGQDPVKKNDAITIAMVATEKSMLDDRSFNAGTYEGIKNYAEAHKLKYKAYEPENQTNAEYLKSIDLAVKDGAKIIITPGFNFETSVFTAQDKYPDIKFILIDGIPNNGKEGDERVEKIGANTCSVMFDEHEAGFLAGYSSVKEGFRKLGFLGGRAFPAVIRYGYGYIQGAEYAAKEAGLEAASIEMSFDYCGDFIASPQNQARAASWYNNGIEVIFACGGAIGLSVMAAAEAVENKWVIGVDSDQSADSARVLTSAMKMISTSVERAISLYYDGSFPGGESLSHGVLTDGVGLPNDFSRFKNFKEEDYNKIYAMLKDNVNGIRTGIVSDYTALLSSLNLTHVQMLEKP